MTAYVVSILLASALLVITLLYWRRTVLFAPISLLMLSVIGWSLGKVFAQHINNGFWLVEWLHLAVIFLALSLFLRAFDLHFKKLTLFCASLILLGLTFSLLEFTQIRVLPAQWEIIFNALFLSFVILLMMHKVMEASNKLSEVIRTEVAPLGVTFGLMLLINFGSMLYLALFEKHQTELEQLRAIVNSLAMAFGLLFIQRIDREILKYSDEQYRQGTDRASQINILAAGVWLTTAGFVFLNNLENWKEYSWVWLVAILSLLIYVSIKKHLLGQFVILVTKLFSTYKYNYRSSWLGFNHALDEATVMGDFYPLSIKALANIINSPSGRLWSRRGNRFTLTEDWHWTKGDEIAFKLPSTLVSFIENTNWVIDTDEYKSNPQLYQELEINIAETLFERSQIFIPLRRGEELVAIVGLEKGIGKQNLNWEDHDVLKAAGQQMASYLALYEATTQIYEQKQFEAFNRLSTFVVHDLKNVTAQLELITHNAKSFSENKEFIADTFDTVGSATNRLNKMLDKLKRNPEPSNIIQKAMVKEVFKIFSQTAENISVISDIPDVEVVADKEQMINIIQHLHQNAIEASDSEKLITHRIEVAENELYWHIIDQGKGMSAEFLKTKLFKPFETTKGNAGMGIGVYQCRYLLQSFGGELIINSRLGQGTECTAVFLLIDDE